MIISTLLQTALMKNAKVICGNTGLSNEVTWCAPDTSIDSKNRVIPGLLLLYTGNYNHLSHSEYFEAILKITPSGIVVFGKKEVNYINEDFVAFCDANNLPLIRIASDITFLSFSKQFASIIANELNTKYCREEWLYKLCYSDYLPSADYLGDTYGYISEYNYYCLLISIRKTSENDPYQREFTLTQARQLLCTFFTNSRADILSFIIDLTLVAFIPCSKNTNTGSFRSQVISAANKIRSKLNHYSWSFTVGTVAESLEEFKKSFSTAMQTANIIIALNVHEKVSFYNDWYMHMLLLNEPAEELQKHMEYTLHPILDTPELLETLCEYLVNGENIKLTAEKLFIHVNTLKYRLHRISELLNCDLKDPNIRFRLRMAITIERYLNNQ